jgi:hypothetical protein
MGSSSERNLTMTDHLKDSSLLRDFKIDSPESCAKAIRNGGIAAFVSAGVTALFGIASFFTDSTDQDIRYFLDPWILADAVFLVVLGFFILRKSRVAATLLMVYFVGSKLLMWYELGKPAGLFMSVIFFLFYLTALRGTYLWHSKYRSMAQDATTAMHNV